MATKTAAKKPAAKKAAAKTVKKVAPTKKPKLPVGIVTEKNPEDHLATGKYKFFFAFFGITTIMFAAICVWLFIFSSEVLEKWESLRTCARNGTCIVEYVEKYEGEDEEVEGEAEEPADTEEVAE